MAEDLPKYVDVEEVISKKIASLEVLKVHQVVKLMGFLNIGGVFTVLLANIMNRTLGMGLAVILCVINGFFLVKSKNEILRLENTYKVKAEPAKVF